MDFPVARPRAGASCFRRDGVRRLALLAGVALCFAHAAAGAQNLIANPGFENNPPSSLGNNIGWPINPWILGPGNNSNVVKVNGGTSYGNSGPRFDADPATNTAGTVQHYLDIAAGSNDFYQAFVVPSCGAAPGQTKTATFSGWFSTRDNLAGTGAIRIVEGAGLYGTVLAQVPVSLPAPANPPGSMDTPWVQASATVTVQSGSTISYVVAMTNNLNFDQASLTFDDVTCVTAALTLRKSWVGASVGDRATVRASRNGVVVDTLASAASSTDEIDADSTPLQVFQGEAIDLSEALDAANVGIYDTTLACTGGGTLAGSTLTVDGSGTPIVCTYTNTGRTSNLSITKTASASELVAGTSLTYAIVARNDGARHANGAVLRDPVVPGLTCTSVGCAADGGAVCPASPSVAALQDPAGLAIPQLPAGGQVTLTLACTVAP
jgi:uncharacterized repeat protein (TIGR01451 family)